MVSGKSKVIMETCEAGIQREAEGHWRASERVTGINVDFGSEGRERLRESRSDFI